MHLLCWHTCRQAGAEGGGAPVTTAACGECCVTTRWLGFYRVWQGSGEVFDAVDLFLPDVQFNTQVGVRDLHPSRSSIDPSAG